MRLGTRGRYAVMAMSDLACQAAEPVPLAGIAERQQISLPYLEQLFARLRAGGLVCSVRGPGGGYRLAQTPDAICIADIVLCVGEDFEITRCGRDRHHGCMGGRARCLTHNLWAGLGDQIIAYLRSVRLSDVVAQRVPPSLSETEHDLRVS